MNNVVKESEVKIAFETWISVGMSFRSSGLAVSNQVRNTAAAPADRAVYQMSKSSSLPISAFTSLHALLLGDNQPNLALPRQRTPRRCSCASRR
jgi:hypothetical protein